MNKNLVEHAETIDAYMKEICPLLNEDTNKKYCSLLDTCYFHYNNGFLTSESKVDFKLFDFVDAFMDSVLPLHKRVSYINFYERRLNKTWKQPYMDSREIKVFKNTPTMEEIEDKFGTTKWWEQAYGDF